MKIKKVSKNLEKILLNLKERLVYPIIWFLIKSIFKPLEILFEEK